MFANWTRRDAIALVLGLGAMIVFVSVATAREWPIYIVAAFFVLLWAILMVVYRDGWRRKL